MSSLALLEAEIPSPLYVTGKNNVDVFLALMVAVVAFPLCMDVVEVMVVSRAAERWERWERVPSQFEILAAILADDLRTFVAK